MTATIVWTHCCDRELFAQLTHNVFTTLIEGFAEIIWDKRCSNLAATFAKIYF